MFTYLNDTIVAISTPLTGKSGIGIVRMSGPDAINIADKIFVSKDNKKVSEFNSFTIHYGWIIDKNNNVVDEVLVSVMLEPKTYTRENIVEISCHGGQVILRKILNLCIEYGARLAEPGEFTKRAFLNGRIDLIQAEAVCDLINSKTEQSANVSLHQLKGLLSTKINSMKTKIVDLISHFEAEINFPDDYTLELSLNQFIDQVNILIAEIDKLINTAIKGKIYREGIKLAIVGKPNVGKSSLLNCLLAEERAIVSSYPGTTRDVITETFNLKGIPVTIMDTAGITSHYMDSNKIENIAIEKSKNAINEAEIIIFLCDISSDISNDDKIIADLVYKSGKKFLLVFNKIDLIKNISDCLQKYISAIQIEKNIEYCNVSVLNNIGIDNLKDTLYKIITEDTNSFPTPDVTDTVIITNLRHELLLKECKKNLEQSIIAMKNNESAEFIVFYLNRAINNLGEITGEVSVEDILDKIFSNFCIGK